MAKVLCEGVGTTPIEIRIVSGEKHGKCGVCGRILVPKKNGELRQHQPRGRTTVTTDKLMDGLWEGL